MAYRGQDCIGIVLGEAKLGEGLPRLHGAVRYVRMKRRHRSATVGPGQKWGVRARWHGGDASRNDEPKFRMSPAGVGRRQIGVAPQARRAVRVEAGRDMGACVVRGGVHVGSVGVATLELGR